jgi:hypothetical protein
VHGGWRFDILWSSFFISRARRWWFNRKRKQKLSRAVRGLEVMAEYINGLLAYTEAGQLQPPFLYHEAEEHVPSDEVDQWTDWLKYVFGEAE